MAKKPKIEDVDDIENDDVENDEGDDVETPPAPSKPVKSPVFPKKLPASEPPPPARKSQKDDLIKEMSEKVEALTSVIAEAMKPEEVPPTPPAPKKREYRLFDEFDPTLEME